MSGWADFQQEAPDLAGMVRSRFTHHKHCLLATVRRDGSPRLSGIELWFWKGEAWLGLMPGSAKGSDLDRDPRFELHSAPTDLDLEEPDARIHGIAERVSDDATIAAFAADLPHPAPPPHEMDLFRIEPTQAVLVRVEGDELVMESWSPGVPPKRQTRR